MQRGPLMLQLGQIPFKFLSVDHLQASIEYIRKYTYLRSNVKLAFTPAPHMLPASRSQGSPMSPFSDPKSLACPIQQGQGNAPADLVLKGGRIFDLVTGTIYGTSRAKNPNFYEPVLLLSTEDYVYNPQRTLKGDAPTYVKASSLKWVHGTPGFLVLPVRADRAGQRAH